jgi:prepilin-type N-terminal cleavage/methylation domain-containing protein
MTQPSFLWIKKPFFTLLEVLVVMMIIASLAVLTGVKLMSAYSEQCFLSETEQVLNHLQMAQDLMILLDTDVTLKFSLEGAVECWLEVEKPLVVRKSDVKEFDPLASLKWSQLVQRHLPLYSIEWVEFKEEGSKSLEESQEGDQRNLCLSFSLGRMPTGKLSLGTSRDNRIRTIHLVGFPCSIKDQEKVKQELEKFTDENKKRQESEILYPQLEPS